MLASVGPMTRILIIDGHPDPDPGRFSHALATAYEAGASEAGHAVARIEVARIDFPMLRTASDYRQGEPPADIRAAQDALREAQHVVLLYPLWLGSLPSLTKAFLEQLLRPGFAREVKPDGAMGRPLLTGRSARIVVPMAMPAWAYRWYFGAHSLRSLERNVLRFVGIGPIRRTLIGSVENLSDAKRKAWLAELAGLGRRAA
jgi:putative NADPH-quinone reductase